MPKGLVKKAKRLYRQVKEGPKYHAEEQKRKSKTAKKKATKKKNWASGYNARTRKIIGQLRNSGVSDDDIKSLLDK